jgi:hypothetical protein
MDLPCPPEWATGHDCGEYLFLGYDWSNDVLTILLAPEQAERVDSYVAGLTPPHPSAPTALPWDRLTAGPRCGFAGCLERLASYQDGFVRYGLNPPAPLTDRWWAGTLTTLRAIGDGIDPINVRTRTHTSQLLAWRVALDNRLHARLVARPAPALRANLAARGAAYRPVVRIAMIGFARRIGWSLPTAEGLAFRIREPDRIEVTVGDRLLLGPDSDEAAPPDQLATGLAGPDDVLIAMAGLGRLCDLARS